MVIINVCFNLVLISYSGFQSLWWIVEKCKNEEEFVVPKYKENQACGNGSNRAADSKNMSIFTKT